MNITLSAKGAMLKSDGRQRLLDSRCVVICGFPGVGKSTFADKKVLWLEGRTKRSVPKSWRIIDLESSEFDKSMFPENYVGHIANIRDRCDELGNRIVICCSSHKDVREELLNSGIVPVVVIPSLDDKAAYEASLRARVGHPAPVDIIMANLDAWIKEIEDDERLDVVRLQPGQHLSQLITLA